MADFIDQLPVHLVLDQGKLVVAHAGLPKTMHGRVGGAVRGFALNGDADGTVDATGRKRRLDWALDYDGEAAVAYGHAPETDGTWRNKTICIDRGCVFGGSLAALRWPERSVVAVPSGTRFDKELDEAFPIAKDDGKRKESKTTKEIAEEREDDEESVIPNALALLSGGSFQTRLAGRIKIERERAAAAFETISRFSVDPRLLAYIPPTIPPVKASRRPDLLEHPDEAMEQYAAKGVETIILEKKHMGSRCLLLIGKNDEAIRRDFGILRPGSIQTRSGRPFLQSAEEERIVIERLRRAMERSGLWNELDADWILLDAEALPWSAKADGLVKDVFAPLGVAAGIELATLEAKLSELRARGIDDEGMLEKARKRLADIRAYDVVWKSHRARIERPSDIAIAPFHVLAHRGKTLETVSHERHLELAGRLADVEEKIIRTEARLVTLSDPASRADGVRFWEEIVEAGGEGIVAKPNEFTASKNGKIIQPALKVRGADYLRIVYGPHYLEPERLAEIKRRDLSRKSTLAIREFALGIEGLKRFVEGDGIRAANAYAFAALALDSEPIDSRL
jgi:protein phosphatase